MTGEPFQFIVRRPRHVATASDRCRLRIELVTREPVVSLDGKLVDLSRNGVQVSLGIPLTTGERVVLHIADADDTFRIAVPARVRWQRSYGNSEPHIGCQFDEELGYEVMGELFLSGILDTGAV